MSFQNWHEEFEEFWLEHSKASRICALVRSFCTKYIMLELRKYRRVMFHDTEEWCKIWRKTDLCFGKWHWGIWQIFTEALESLKIGTLIGSFYPKTKMYEPKIYRGVMYHDYEKWFKIWRGIDLSFQNWHHNLMNFDPSTQMSQKFAL